jgi:hypothetical protein
MKKLIYIFFLFLSTAVFGQSSKKLRSDVFSEKHLLRDGTWTDFSDWAPSNCLILVEDYRVTIFSQQKQTYDIISVIKEYENEKSQVTVFDCLDENNTKCQMTFTHITQNNQKSSYLYFEFANVILMYKIYKLD